MEPQKIIFSTLLGDALAEAITEVKYDQVFILVDTTTRQCCLPVLMDTGLLPEAKIITIEPTDTHKTLDSVTHVWSELQHSGATRHSLMINLGGGMVTDLGGFAASTFKRGIAFINIPTTLLSMVDASVGGKTGFNFGGLKNEIGVFNNALAVILDTIFLHSMDHENMLSGFAEMLKHGLIDCEEHWATLLNVEFNNYDAIGTLVRRSVEVKQRIVLEDPTEKGIRKALNLGHTAGHAFEALSLERTPLLHGYAVAYGLIVELYLSSVHSGFPQDKLRQTITFIKENYGRMDISCDDYPRLLNFMQHDKKNTGTAINFTLLGGMGDIRINNTLPIEAIKEALDFYREC